MPTYHAHFVRKFQSIVSMARSHRPARLPWVQLVLRVAALIVSYAAFVVAIYVIAAIHRVWYMVIISSIITVTIDTAEICGLTSLNDPEYPVPRFHPLLLIWLDFIAIGVLVWSCFWLFLDSWNNANLKPPRPYNAHPWDKVEMWLTVAIGCLHIALLVFDYVDFCHRRRSAQRQREARRLRTVRNQDDSGSVDWG